MLKKQISKVAPLVIGLILLVVACDRNPDTSLIPPDTDPAISLIVPSNNNFLDTVGGTVSATFRLDDNEALEVFRVVSRVYDQQDSVVGNDFIAFEEIISGQRLEKVYNYTVPILPVYYKIRLTVYAIDTKGAYASAFIWINVIPKPLDPSPFELEAYQGSRIFSQRSLSGKHFFDFSANNYINNLLDKDIEEISQLTIFGFEQRLASPNNTAIGNDSIFVFTDESRFNYDQATYESIFEAFYSDPAPYDTTPVIVPNDIIIIRLTNQPHFAVMKVNDVSDPPGDASDYIDFDYKITYEP